MARADLDDLRAQLIDTFYLTSDEVGALKYWSEEKLLETLVTFNAIAEADEDFAAESDDESMEPYDFPDYDDYLYDDLYGFEYEAVIDYGND